MLLHTGASAQSSTNWQQTENRLIRQLSGNSEQKRTALAEIRNLETEEASRLAVRALSDDDEIVRATAAASVVFLPETEAVQALLPLLDDKKPFVRKEAAYALGKVGSTTATNRLIRTLNNDRDREVRATAAIAIGKIGDASAIDDLVATLREKPNEDNELIRRSAARSIGQVFDLHAGGTTYAVTPQNFLPPKFKELGTEKSLENLKNSVDVKTVVSVLSRTLQNPKETDDTRREAAFALGAVREDSAIAILRSHLNDPDPYLAEICREALLKIEAPNPAKEPQSR